MILIIIIDIIASSSQDQSRKSSSLFGRAEGFFAVHPPLPPRHPLEEDSVEEDSPIF